eukprot:SAG31_NODE_4256_length_3414_cov_2.193665_2_plen_297_part_00
MNSSYLRAVGQELFGVVDLCWTGEEIISPTVTASDIANVARVAAPRLAVKSDPEPMRRVVLWDNLHANDYDQGRRLYLGPYNRDPALLTAPALAGILTNPNVQYEANFPALHTLASYVRLGDGYDKEQASEEAAKAWLSRLGPPLELDDVVLLIDLLYMPYSHGPRAVQLMEAFKNVQADPRNEMRCAAFAAAAKKVQRLFDRLTEIEQREACYALYQYLWDLKEELDLLGRHVDWLRRAPRVSRVYADDEAEGTIYPKFSRIYRGGLLSDLQRLLPFEAGAADRNPGKVATFARI